MLAKDRKTTIMMPKSGSNPEIEVARAGKTLKARDLNKALKMIEQEQSYLLSEWHKFRSTAHG
jgi:hypothetical protein